MIRIAAYFIIAQSLPSVYVRFRKNEIGLSKSAMLAVRAK